MPSLNQRDLPPFTIFSFVFESTSFILEDASGNQKDQDPVIPMEQQLLPPFVLLMLSKACSHGQPFPNFEVYPF
jgi:hypothetical protein